MSTPDTALASGMTADLDLFIGAESCTCHATCTCDQESDRLVGFLALLAWLRLLRRQRFWGRA